ncbi:hypothetical protein [Streptomyces umbrinus]|uniref:hypothetical protein n=1 Tax=Streptomyces umbrinus TaxID=67370 RepID=UPI0033ECBF32
MPRAQDVRSGAVFDVGEQAELAEVAGVIEHRAASEAEFMRRRFDAEGEVAVLAAAHAEGEDLREAQRRPAGLRVESGSDHETGGREESLSRRS